MKKIYIADDEENIRLLIQSFLAREGYDVEAFPNGQLLLEQFEAAEPDLIILDIMMPGIDGLNLCAAIRQKSLVPIIIVSAKDSPLDRITGITLGSDDYLVKPFLPLELVARVKALFRRSEMTRKGYDTAAACYCGNLELNRKQHSATVGNQPFSITPTEFAFLEYMMERQETAVQKAELLKEVWKIPDYNINTRIIDDAVKRLRKKLREADCSAAIETVWGYGFRLAPVSQEGHP